MEILLKTKKGRVVVFFVTLLFIFSLLSIFRNIIFYRDLHTNIVSGKIIFKSNTSLQIEDIRKEVKDVLVPENVEIKKGTSTINFNDLATGTFILVVLNTTEVNKGAATKIRILDPKSPRLKK